MARQDHQAAPLSVALWYIRSLPVESGTASVVVTGNPFTSLVSSLSRHLHVYRMYHAILPSLETILFAINLVEKFRTRYPALFNESSFERVYLCSLVAANRYLSDTARDDEYYAKLCGVGTAEFTAFHLEYLGLMFPELSIPRPTDSRRYREWASMAVQVHNAGFLFHAPPKMDDSLVNSLIARVL